MPVLDSMVLAAAMLATQAEASTCARRTKPEDVLTASSVVVLELVAEKPRWLLRSNVGTSYARVLRVVKGPDPGPYTPVHWFDDGYGGPPMGKRFVAVDGIDAGEANLYACGPTLGPEMADALIMGTTNAVGDDEFKLDAPDRAERGTALLTGTHTLAELTDAWEHFRPGRVDPRMTDLYLAAVEHAGGRTALAAIAPRFLDGPPAATARAWGEVSDPIRLVREHFDSMTPGGLVAASSRMNSPPADLIEQYVRHPDVRVRRVMVAPAFMGWSPRQSKGPKNEGWTTKLVSEMFVDPDPVMHERIHFLYRHTCFGRFQEGLPTPLSPLVQAYESGNPRLIEQARETGRECRKQYEHGANPHLADFDWLDALPPHQ